ncbi:MAG: hypothetical protein JSU87_04700 [Gemmatimonadota bacterium]|nr:MAG: hypothetical protein JSU87_04700 [Gemmatimonadota bacterium]
MPGELTPRRSARSIFIFWVPLAATWLMMALEGPFLAAVIARLADPKFNLAAYGVAFAFALLVEAPVIMIMSASTALVEDAGSYRKLRNYTYALNAGITALMLVVIVPPIFYFLAETLIGLPENVARLTHVALLFLIPWPAAIGYRRFFQGLLIRAGLTRLVAYGTVVRLSSMALTALALYVTVKPAGAYLGAIALSAGVCGEALAARLMAVGTVRRLLATTADIARTEKPLDYRGITVFYVPLALTSILGLAVQPMVTFFMGRAPHPVESLAVLPVVISLSFVFRAMGLSYQEVAIALMGKRFEHARELGRFALILGLASSLGLALIGFTPLARFWFETVSGLTRELAAFAVPPTRILAILPGLSVLLSYQRAILVQGRFTGPITTSTAIEVVGILVVLLALTQGWAMVGATAAAIGFIVGRLGGNIYLVRPCLHTIGRSKV